MPTNPDDLHQLRRDLLARFDAHPIRDWHPTLLAAVIAVIDVEYGSPPPQPGRRLSLVPKPSNR